MIYSGQALSELDSMLRDSAPRVAVWKRRLVLHLYSALLHVLIIWFLFIAGVSTVDPTVGLYITIRIASTDISVGLP